MYTLLMLTFCLRDGLRIPTDRNQHNSVLLYDPKTTSSLKKPRKCYMKKKTSKILLSDTIHFAKIKHDIVE